MQQYVLNRVMGGISAAGGLEGAAIAEQAELAFLKIKELTKETIK